MSQLTLAKLISSVKDELPGKELAVIVRAANKVIRRIQKEYLELERGTFTTKVKVTTGTVGVTQDSASVTFTDSVLSSSDPLVLVQIEGDSEWFILTRVTNTTGTLGSVWAQATDTAATFTIVYPTVSFANTVGQVVKIQRSGYPELKFRIGGSCPYAVGTPLAYSPYKHNSTAAAPSDDLTRYFLDPAPDSRVVYSFWARPRTAYLDSSGLDTQVVPLTDEWDDAVEAGVLFYCWKQEKSNPGQTAVYKALYEEALGRTRGAESPGAVVLHPKNRRGSLYNYEEHPVGGDPY